jgi:phage pi2 protein 07
MKINYILQLLIAVLITTLFTINCSKSSETLLEEAIAEYNGGNKNIAATIGSLLLATSSDGQFDAKNVIINPSSLYTKDSDEIHIIYPVKKDIDIPDGEKKYYVHVDNKIVAISDGSQISYLDENDEFFEDVVLADDKEKIKSIYVKDNSIVYYKNFKLYQFSFDTEESDTFIKGSFNPYYKKFYNANFFIRNNRLALITGIAGAYKISVIDLLKQKTLVKNVKASSSNIYFLENFFYYLSGSTGSWKVTKFSINSKNKDYISTIKSITDFGFSETGFVYENKKGVFISDYTGKQYVIPFKYLVMGSCAEKIVIRYSGILYMVNHDSLLKGIQSLKVKAPELFD